jgi:hypothetical protein
MADSSLLTSLVVATTGLLGTAIGIAGTLLVQLRIEREKQQFEKQKQEYERQKEIRQKKAEKLEELVLTLYEHNHYLEIMRRVYFGLRDGPLPVSPFSKIQAITDVYFHEFDKLVEELNDVVIKFSDIIEDKKQHADIRSSSLRDPDSPQNAYTIAYQSYRDHVGGLLTAISLYSKREFQ